MWTLSRLLRRTARGPTRLLEAWETPAAYALFQRPWQPRQYVSVPGWDLWWERLGQLEEFCATHNCIPRQSAGSQKPLLEPNESSLGTWCSNQRQRWKGNRAYGGPLRPEQMEALEGIPAWQWDPRAELWWRRCDEVATFVQQHGQLPRTDLHGRPPLTADEVVLGDWCTRQRLRRRGQGMHAPLSPEQLAALQRIPGWAWEPNDERWEQRCAEVEAFVQQHGQLPRTALYDQPPLTTNELVLGEWCSTQRKRRKGVHKYVPQSSEELAALQHIPGWAWDPRDERWWQRCAEVAAFVQVHGQLPREKPGDRHLAPNEQVLGVWCTKQRQRGRGKGTCAPLSADQQAALERIPNWWWKAGAEGSSAIA